MSKEKKKGKSKDIISMTLYVLFIIAVLIIAILLLNGLDRTLRSGEKRPTNYSKYFDNVTKIVFVNGKRDSDGNMCGAYFDDNSDIKEIKEIVTSTTFHGTTTLRDLENRAIQNMKKYMCIFHENGDCDVFVFYGAGCFYHMDPEGNYGYMQYDGKNVSDFISKNQKYGCSLTDDFEVIEYGTGFTAEKFFGEHYKEPWWGY